LAIEAENRVYAIASEGVVETGVLYDEGVYDEFEYEPDFSTPSGRTLNILFENRTMAVSGCQNER